MQGGTESNFAPYWPSPSSPYNIPTYETIEGSVTILSQDPVLATDGGGPLTSDSGGTLVPDGSQQPIAPQQPPPPLIVAPGQIGKGPVPQTYERPVLFPQPAPAQQKTTAPSTAQPFIVGQSNLGGPNVLGR